jgi:hypothetical protein
MNVTVFNYDSSAVTFQAIAPGVWTVAQEELFTGGLAFWAQGLLCILPREATVSLFNDDRRSREAVYTEYRWI